MQTCTTKVDSMLKGMFRGNEKRKQIHKSNCTERSIYTQIFSPWLGKTRRNFGETSLGHLLAIYAAWAHATEDDSVRSSKNWSVSYIRSLVIYKSLRSALARAEDPGESTRAGLLRRVDRVSELFRFPAVPSPSREFQLNRIAAVPRRASRGSYAIPTNCVGIFNFRRRTARGIGVGSLRTRTSPFSSRIGDSRRRRRGRSRPSSPSSISLHVLCTPRLRNGGFPVDCRNSGNFVLRSRSRRVKPTSELSWPNSQICTRIFRARWNANRCEL